VLHEHRQRIVIVLVAVAQRFSTEVSDLLQKI
jgi:hypothetical protein